MKIPVIKYRSEDKNSLKSLFYELSQGIILFPQNFSLYNKPSCIFTNSFNQ
jgi:hypothetical protein